MLWSIQPLTTFKSTIGLIGSLFALRCEGAGGASEFISDWQTVAHFFVQFLTISHHSLSFKVFSQKTHECIFLAFVLIWIQHNWSLGRHLRLHCLSSSIGNSTASLSLSPRIFFINYKQRFAALRDFLWSRKPRWENKRWSNWPYKTVENFNARKINRWKNLYGMKQDERVALLLSPVKSLI